MGSVVVVGEIGFLFGEFVRWKDVGFGSRFSTWLIVHNVFVVKKGSMRYWETEKCTNQPLNLRALGKSKYIGILEKFVYEHSQTKEI